MMTTRRAALVTAVCASVIAAGVILCVRVVMAADAGSTDVCVTLTNSAGRVSGLQLDLTWDPSCMTAQKAEGDAAACSSNPATRKNVQTKLFPNNATMRALFLSVSDTNPVPDDELFCCRFALAQPGSCCALSVNNLILAGPKPTGGIGRIYDPDILVQTTVGGAPCVASPPGGSEENPVHPAPPPIVAAPPVYAPQAPAERPAPAPPAQQQAAPRAKMPAGAPLAGEQAAQPMAGVTPAESATAAAVTTAARPTGTRPKTAAVAPTKTPPVRTPQALTTPTGPAASITQAATTPTPKAKAKRKAHKKKRASAPSESSTEQQE